MVLNVEGKQSGMSKHRLKSKDSTRWGRRKARVKDKRDRKCVPSEGPEGNWQGWLDSWILTILSTKLYDNLGTLQIFTHLMSQ